MDASSTFWGSEDTKAFPCLAFPLAAKLFTPLLLLLLLLLLTVTMMMVMGTGMMMIPS